MSYMQEIGNIEKNKEVMEIEWEITDFFSIAAREKEFKSTSFSFANTTWHLRQNPKSDMTPELLYIYLVSTGSLKCPVEYKFGLKKLDGCVAYTVKGILNCNEAPISGVLTLEWKKMQKRKSELAPSGVLIIICALEYETIRFGRSKILNPPKLKKCIKLDTLSENFKRLFLNKESCDTVLHVVDKEYKAHRTVLIARSSVFAAMFAHETSEKQTGIVTIPDCDPESFGKFLMFLYSGKLENPSCNSALHLYEISDKYNVLELKTFCSEFLVENLTVEDFCNFIIMADKYDDANLLSAAQCFFNKNLAKILVTSEWECLIKTNYSLANKFMIEMSLKVKVLD